MYAFNVFITNKSIISNYRIMVYDRWGEQKYFLSKIMMKVGIKLL